MGLTFRKRSNGEIRTGTFRIGVTKHLRGGERAYDPADHDLITVFDLNRRGYRSVPVEGLLAIVANGNYYEVE